MSGPQTKQNEPWKGLDSTDVAHLTENAPTDSHALAAENIDIAKKQDATATQIEPHDLDVQDAGWNEIDSPGSPSIICGFSNEQLWTLIRRFDSQTFHVKKINEPPLANLDMNIAEDEEFSPEKLRAHLERLYTSVIVQLVAAWKQIDRLRSWHEYRRTSAYLAVYATAWALDILLPVLFTFLLVLVLFAPARRACFPPVAIKLNSSAEDGEGRQEAGPSDADNTLTGVPEIQAGEGVEQEAHSFLNSIATLLISTSAGKREKDAESSSETENAPDINTPDMTQLQKDVIYAEDKPGGDTKLEKKTKQSVSKIVWKRAEETMRITAQFVDTWERFANALSPSPPFRRRTPKLLLALCLVLPLLGSYFLTGYLLIKGFGLVIGMALFGHPALSKSKAVISRSYPRFKKYLELRHSILRGVPTNAQLTVTLLRIGERSKTPVPPPQASELTEDKLAYIEREKDTSAQEQHHKAEVEQTKKRGGFLGLLRAVTGGGIHVFLATDKVKAAVGVRHARNRLGVVEPQNINPLAGPVRFPARHKGRKGHAYITMTATSPALSWTSSLKDVNPAWTIPIADIVDVQKVGGLGWKSKIMVHWALEKEVVDGVILKTARGEEYHLTAVTLRDELFNRLISAGPQMWESL